MEITLNDVEDKIEYTVFFNGADGVYGSAAIDEWDYGLNYDPKAEKFTNYDIRDRPLHNQALIARSGWEEYKEACTLLLDHVIICIATLKNVMNVVGKGVMSQMVQEVSAKEEAYQDILRQVTELIKFERMNIKFNQD